MTVGELNGKMKGWGTPGFCGACRGRVAAWRSRRRGGQRTQRRWRPARRHVREKVLGDRIRRLRGACLSIQEKAQSVERLLFDRSSSPAVPCPPAAAAGGARRRRELTGADARLGEGAGRDRRLRRPALPAADGPVRLGARGLGRGGRAAAAGGHVPPQGVAGASGTRVRPGRECSANALRPCRKSLSGNSSLTRKVGMCQTRTLGLIPRS